MPTLMEIERRLGVVFSDAQADVLSELMHEAQAELARIGDFNELKVIVQDLAGAQRRTEIKVGELVEAQKRTEARVEELAEAQKRTEARVGELAEAQRDSNVRITRLERIIEELAEAQKRTEARVEELAEAQKDSNVRITRLERIIEELAEAQKDSNVRITRLERIVEELAEAQKRTEAAIGELTEAQKRSELALLGLAGRVEQLRTELGGQIEQTRAELGGLSRTFSYAFENEAYRMIPEVLRKAHGIDLHERMIRAEIGDHEINLLGRGTKDGQDVVVVGESKLRLDDRRQREERDVFDELAEKIAAVKTEYGTENVIGLLTAHFATRKTLKRAEEEGVIVVQSYEW